MLRAAVVGFGTMGRNHLRVLAEMPDVRVVALCDVKSGRMIDGPWKRLSNFQDLAAEDIDFCVIATPTSTHAQIALHLAQCGIPLLIEKPLALSVSEAQEILSLVSQKNGRVAVGMVERFNGTAIEAKRICESGEFGRLLKISARRVGPSPDRDLGTGVLLDLGIHDLDLVEWITGHKLTNLDCRFIRNVVSQYDDLVVGTGALYSGAVVQIEASWLSPTKERFVNLLFEHAAATFNLLTGEVVVDQVVGEESKWQYMKEIFGTKPSRRVSYRVKAVEPLAMMHKALVAAVISGNWAAMPSGDDAERLLSIMEPWIQVHPTD